MTKEKLNDFGFSFEDEVDVVGENERETYVKTASELQDEINRLTGVNREILKRVTVLMNNLKKNPDKPMIKWPNRVESIDQFLAELNELHNPKKDQ